MATRPDTALRRSDELLAVNQPAAALSSVSEIFSSKRFRTTPLSSLEPIMLRFLELCVMLRKGRTAKEGLHIYRNVAQNTSVTAVETVIRFFLDKSKEKLDEALAKVDEVAGPAASGEATGTVTTTQTTKEDGTIQTVEVEDLEAAETPESILLSAVSDEKSRDRTYRTLVTPWLRFLWESYRTALDTLRNNARLEVLYQQVALEAFQFCLTHTRKTEFRRLAETLRQHFASAQKYSSANYSINISDPETLQRYLDIRFAQLNTAVELELWQEAFRSAEDIHGLVAASKRTPRASMMASFYEKLVKVFAVGQNFLFHAAAYGKLWSLQAGSGGDDRIAGLVLLSALSVPLASGAELKTKKDPITGEEKDYTRGRMTLMGLLDLPTAPSRETLLKDALKRGILKHVSAELKSLYQIIEKDFHPLRITSKLEPIFASLKNSPETARYVEPLKNVVLSRLFQQLAQVYDSVKIARVVKLATFKDDTETDKNVTQVRVEKFITDACRRGEMSVRLDHAEGIVEFEDRTFGEVNEMEINATSQKSSIDILQPTPSTLLRNHLANLAQTLFSSLETISPAEVSALAYASANAESSLQAMAKNMQAEREALLSRRMIAEQRRQRSEAELAKKEKEAEAARIAARQQSAANEAKRVEQEAKARQLEMIRKNNEAIKQEEARKLADKLKAAGALKVADKEIETMDTAQLRRMQVEQMEKEQKQLSEKLRIIAKRIDHTERAYRKEEIPLLHKDYEVQQKRDRELFDQSRAQRLEDARNAHAADLDLKKRLIPKMKDFEDFKQKKLAASSASYEAAVKKANAKIAEEKKKRIAEYEKAREEEREAARREQEQRQREEEEAARREAEAREREEAERVAREEEEARLAEEKARQDEEREKRRAELLEQRLKGDEQARRQREREEEVERRQKEKEAARRAGVTPGAAAATSRPVVGAGGWRRDAPPTATAGNAANEAAAPAASGPPRLEGLKSSWRDRQAAAAGAGGAAAPAPAAAAAASPPATPAGERPRFALAPRSQPAAAPERSASPASGAAPAAAPTGEKMTWREREALKAQQNGTAPAANGDDGFQAVKKPATGGAYRPPGQRGGADGASRRW